MRLLIIGEATRQGLDVGKVRVLDPMAGIGRVHDLPGKTVGIELEPEWASQHPETKVGDALHLPFRPGRFDVICVSPAYGNRFADHHEAKDGSRRRSYRHDLGRMPTEGSSTVLHWGPKYREFHEAAWAEATRVLMPGGLFVLNVSDFVSGSRGRDGDDVVLVAEWHLAVLFRLGYRLESATTVATPRMRDGANGDRRVDGELVVALRRRP